MKRVLLVILMMVLGTSAFAQVELVPAEHRVYEFLKRMQVAGILKDYNSGNLPYSREEVASFLEEVMKSSDKVTKLQREEDKSLEFRVKSSELKDKNMDSRQEHSGMTRLGRGDVEILKDFMVEFEYEMRVKSYELGVTKNSDRVTKLQGEEVVKNSDRVTKLQGEEVMKKREWVESNKYVNMDSRLVHAGMTMVDRLGSSLEHTGMTGSDFINDNKYIYKYTDSNATMFVNVMGGLNYRNGNGDSVGNRRIGFGDLGVSLRGTLFGRVGYAMSYTNGSMFGGSADDRFFAGMFDPLMRANYDMGTENKYYNDFRGYVRYQVPGKWMAVTVGREAIYQGFGYADRLFFSDNTVPFSFMKLDLKYKTLSYSFIYGNLNGDSAGVPLNFKTFATHRIDVKPLDWMRFGFNESVINTHSAFLFDYVNPLSFLVSADLNTGGINAYKSNSLIGIDAEFYPVRNVSVQTSLLVDDFNMSTLGKNDKSSNDNKFGYQAGVFWNSPFGVSALSAVMEYTRLDPFVYTHRYNRDQYTSYGMPLGHNLPPNSDEIAWKVVYNPWKRLRFEFEYKYQRSGEGFTYDSLGNMTINYGGDINHGEGYLDTIKNVFLQGNRVNRNIVTTSVYYEPVRQWFVEMKYMYRMEDLVFLGRKTRDGFLFLKFGIKI